MASPASLAVRVTAFCCSRIHFGVPGFHGCIQVAAAIQHPSPCCWPLTWLGLCPPGWLVCSACWLVGFTLGHKTKIIAALHFIYRSNKYPVNYSKMATTRPREGGGGRGAPLRYAKVISQTILYKTARKERERARQQDA